MGHPVAIEWLCAISTGPEPVATSVGDGYGVQLFRSVLALAVVCFVAYAVLRWAARRGLRAGVNSRNMKIRERMILDARKSLYLVDVGSRTLLIGASDQSLSTLAELKSDELVAVTPPEPPRSFSEVLAKLRGMEPREKIAETPGKTDQ